MSQQTLDVPLMSRVGVSNEEKTMDVTVNAEVHCTDGFYGHVICIILNPATEQITHVAVQQEEPLSHTRLVSISHVVTSSPDRIQLDVSKKNLERDLPPFIKTEFLESGLPDILYTTELMWPHLIANLEMQPVEREKIPLHELAVHGGAAVEAKDGGIGHLENFIVNPDDKYVTQIVVRTGHSFAQSRLDIPVSAIDHFEEDRIYLSMTKQETRALATRQELHTKHAVVKDNDFAQILDR
jgi:uncharacterized protein YrrD